MQDVAHVLEFVAVAKDGLDKRLIRGSVQESGFIGLLSSNKEVVFHDSRLLQKRFFVALWIHGDGHGLALFLQTVSVVASVELALQSLSTLIATIARLSNHATLIVVIGGCCCHQKEKPQHEVRSHELHVGCHDQVVVMDLCSSKLEA